MHNLLSPELQATHRELKQRADETLHAYAIAEYSRRAKILRATGWVATVVLSVLLAAALTPLDQEGRQWFTTAMMMSFLFLVMFGGLWWMIGVRWILRKRKRRREQRAAAMGASLREDIDIWEQEIHTLLIRTGRYALTVDPVGETMTIFRPGFTVDTAPDGTVWLLDEDQQRMVRATPLEPLQVTTDDIGNNIPVSLFTAHALGLTESVSSADRAPEGH